MNDSGVELSAEQIKELYWYVEKRGVQYKDLQHELVDHLASSIEEMMTEDPTYAYEIARYMAYKKLKDYGFQSFVESKEHALVQYWRSRFAKYFLQFFRLPQIILTICLTILIFQLTQILDPTVLKWVQLGLGISFLFIYLGIYLFNKYLINKNSQYKVLETYYSSIGIIGLLLYYIPEFLNLIFNIEAIPDLLKYGLLSLFICLYLIITYGVLVVFPKYLKTEIKEKYAHLEIANG